MSNERVYRCNLQCPIRKHCFIIKLKEPVTTPLVVLHKCEATKRDVEITIGDPRPP